MRIQRFRRLGPAVVLAGLLSLIPAAALADSTTYQVAGKEILAINSAGTCSSPDLSSFAGKAFSGSAFAGYWAANALHARLNTSTGGTTEICGGSFALRLNSGSTLSGAFADNPTAITAGPPTHTVPGAACSQDFAVSDSLLNGPGGTPIGSFTADLTHYGTWTGSACQTPTSLLAFLLNPSLIPTVQGEVTFN
jgi:hypothetical protein